MVGRQGLCVPVSSSAWSSFRSTPRIRSAGITAVAVSSASARFASPIGFTQATSMSPVVMVPVLSRHSTSTRASVSMQ